MSKPNLLRCDLCEEIFCPTIRSHALANRQFGGNYQVFEGHHICARCCKGLLKAQDIGLVQISVLRNLRQAWMDAIEGKG